jgi:hypothetical protein
MKLPCTTLPVASAPKASTPGPSFPDVAGCGGRSPDRVAGSEDVDARGIAEVDRARDVGADEVPLNQVVASRRGQENPRVRAIDDEPLHRTPVAFDGEPAAIQLDDQYGVVIVGERVLL